MTGSALLLSGCNYEQTESGEGNSQDDILNDEENSENNEQNEENIDSDNNEDTEAQTTSHNFSVIAQFRTDSSSGGYVTASTSLSSSYPRQAFSVRWHDPSTYVTWWNDPTMNSGASGSGSTTYAYASYFSYSFSNAFNYDRYAIIDPYSYSGWTCVGMSTSSSFSNSSYTSSSSGTRYYNGSLYTSTPSTDTSVTGTVYVKFRQNYTLSYSFYQGTSQTGFSTSMMAGVGPTLSVATSSRPGYTQIGWSTTRNDTTPDYDLGEEVSDSFANGNKILYAVYEKETYDTTLSVYFAENYGTYNVSLQISGTDLSTDTISEGETATFSYETDGSASPITVTVRETSPSPNYFYVGETTSPSSGVTYDFTWDRNSSKSVSIYTEQQYAISYDANGGSGTTPTTYYCYNDSSWPKVESNEFSRSGYRFVGWATSSSGSVEYQPGDTYSYNGYPTLYAVWERNTYTITYNGNGATGGSTAPTTVNAGSSVALRSNGFTRTGYSFSGWATSASGNKVYSNGQTITPTGNMTLYAVWVDNINPTISRVTYAQNGGTSYYAYAYASDSGSGLNRVQFPTWTANYDQDDIEWYTGTAGSWTVGGQTYNYRYLVQASNHGGEYGTYITHVYAYDNAGNSIGNGSMTNIRMTSSVSVNPNGGTYNGSSATSATTQNSGKTLGLNFARAGYNLSNVTSTAGTLSKSQVTGTMTFSGSNYVNLGRTYMYSNKLTWAVTAYMDNWSQYQSGNMRLISCTESGGFNLEPNGSTVRFAVYDKARAGYNSITTSVTWASLSGWVQFAMVFDGHYARGYIDGELVGTSTYEYTNGIGFHSSNAIFIGAEAGSNATKPAGNYFKGKIRSVHIINEAVNQEDLANLDNQYALYVKGNTTVTASWSVATYTVSYNANGGTLQGLNYIMRTSNYSSTRGGISVSYNATTGLITLNGTVTSNYEFLQTQSSSNFSTGTYIVGWDVVSGSMSATGGGLWFQFKDTSTSPYTFGPSGGSSRAPLHYQGSINLTSSEMDNFYSWYQRGYTFNNAVIRFYGYKQNSAVSSQQITYGTNTNTPYATRTGFYFSGWNTKADGTGTTYGSGNIGSITANTTLYAQWTARNEANYDSAGGYWYVENGKIPQTKVTNSTLISNLNKATTNGANYYIAGQTLTAKVYSGKEYCKWNNNWYEVEPIRWRLDYSSSQTNGYGTTSATSAVLAEIVYVGQYSSSNIGSGAGYSSTAVTQFLRNGIDTTFLSTYTASTQTFGNGTSLYGSANVSSNMFVASSSEINSVSETLAVGFSDLVKDIIKANGGTSVYFTRDLGSNYNNIVCFNEVGREVQRFATDYRGVQFVIRFTEYVCVA